MHAYAAGLRGALRHGARGDPALTRTCAACSLVNCAKRCALLTVAFDIAARVCNNLHRRARLSFSRPRDISRVKGYEKMPIDETNDRDAYEVAEDAREIGEGEPVNDGAEAHRYAEFEDLKDRIEGIARMIEALTDTMKDGFAQFASVAVDSGAVIRDDEEVVGLADADEEPGELTPIEDLVFFD